MTPVRVILNIPSVTKLYIRSDQMLNNQLLMTLLPAMVYCYITFMTVNYTQMKNNLWK